MHDPGIRYRSTRARSTPGGAGPRTFDFGDVTLNGLAADGGLYVPERWPAMTPEEMRALRGLDYAATAVRVLSPFVAPTLNGDALHRLCSAAYGTFDHRAVVPLRQLDGRHWLLELFHGPTLAFKDVALQLLGQIFAHLLAARAAGPLTIVGATSGDTGSAAIAAVAGLPGVRIAMLHPAGRVSEVQRRQMTSIVADNVLNLAVDTDFDGAQAMVKRLFVDPKVRLATTLGAVNSINWARIAAQLVYYFHAAVQLGAPDRRIAFSVPTGNFGDVYAGHVAGMMGLPIERLIVATNENDIVHRALSGKSYERARVLATATPSMDIAVSSNFERLLWETGGCDGDACAAAMDAFERTGRLDMTIAQRRLIADRFASARVDDGAMRDAMRWSLGSGGEPVDPHTAIGLAAARRLEADIAPDVPIVTLATAHPAKFPDVVRDVTGVCPALPQRLADLMDRPERVEHLPDDYAVVRSRVLALAAGA